MKVVEIDHSPPICPCIRFPVCVSVPQIAGRLALYSLMFHCVFPVYKGNLPHNHSITVKTELLVLISIKINIGSSDTKFPPSHILK